MATAKIPIRTKGRTTCVHHKGKQLELYCEKCQELTCLKCLSSIHKSHPVCELSEITPQKKLDIINFIDRTEQNDQVQIGKYITSTDTLLNENDSTFEKLSHQLRMQTDNLKQDLDMLTAETLSLYQKMKEDNSKLIQKYKQDLEMYDKQLKQQIQECKTALQQGSDLNIYDTRCEIDSQIHFPVKPVLGNVSFTPNKNPQGHLKLALGKVIISGQGQTSTDQDRSVSTSDGQGQSSTQQQSGHKGKKAVTRYKLLSETKVVEEWECPCYINSICPTTDDQAWTSDYYGETLTLLDRNSKGTVIQEVTHKAVVKDISLSPTTNRLWVCDPENNILELVSGQLTHRFRTKKKPECLCVTASNHVIVGMAKHISKFTTQGQMVLTTMAVRTRKPLVCTPWRITECPVTHNVAVIDFSDKDDGGDGNKHVVVMDTNLQELFVYRGDIPSTYKTLQTGGKPFYPRSVVYDSVGNLIIGDYSNNRVLLLSGGGEFLRIIHTDTDLTWAVGVDRKDVLWAVFGGDNVKLLQHSSM
ncbi:E3 ubiquitin-protein ligase TRIM71-like [Pecten maximus]|uniref:E3 ubiquitin-protein ligase TRIM71-like n=1 Tax=Pecten maximus TaxID=6579 RepID=UPI001458DACF|nr:E3 ubiquitin-protein ligase TRIM71-like [Pecten maximus]